MPDYAPTLLLARDATSQKSAPLVLPFFGGSSSSICRDVFLSPVVFSPSRHSKDDVFFRRSVFFPSTRRSRKNGGKECRRQKTERRRRRVHFRVFFRRFVGVADCFSVLHVRSIRVRKGGYGTGGEKGQGESESGAQDAVWKRLLPMEMMFVKVKTEKHVGRSRVGIIQSVRS